MYGLLSALVGDQWVNTLGGPGNARPQAGGLTYGPLSDCVTRGAVDGGRGVGGQHSRLELGPDMKKPAPMDGGRFRGFSGLSGVFYPARTRGKSNVDRS